MANFSLTLTQLTAAALHATGKTAGLDTGNNVTDLINQAIQYLANFTSWSWRNKVLSLDFVSGQAYVALPADFSELVLLRGGSVSRRTMVPVSLDTIQLYRQSIASTSSGQSVTYYAYTSTPQASATAAPIARLELFPTPTASETAAAVGVYQRLIPALSSGTDVPDLDPSMLPVVMLAVRGYAKMFETPEQANPELEMAHKMLGDLKTRDGMKQGTCVGRLIGTVQQIDGAGWDGSSRFSTDTPISV